MKEKVKKTCERQHIGFADRTDKSIVIDNVDFKYDPHALKKTVEGISFNNS